jgi:Ig-like domain from next to BRCA1 gene
MKPMCFAPIFLSTALALSACNMPAASAPGSSAISTSAAQTVQAVLSTPAATQALETSIASSTPTTAPTCKDSASITLWTRNNITYDATEVKKPLAPGTVFTMSWTFQNTGTCTWNSNYQMYFDSGTPLTTAASFPMMPAGAFVAPGATVTVDIPMTAPDKAGDYESAFRLQNDHGEAVDTFGVMTKVGSGSSQSLASPGDLRYTYDCTTGTVNISLFWADKSSDEDGFRIYRDGNKLEDVAAGTTSYADVLPYSGKFDYAVAAFNGGGESASHVKVNTSNCK